MEKEIYRLLGTVNIPEDKKKELNKYVMELLHRGGIKKSCEVVLEGKTFTVIKPAVPDENGIVQFDYSFFERKLRQAGSYDTNTCTLTVSDRGYNEYGLVMNLIMFLLEIYSGEMCLLMDEDVPLAHPEGYLRLLNGLLGVEFFNDKRYRMWDMFYFLYQNGIKDIKYSAVWDGAILCTKKYWEHAESYFEIGFSRDYAEITSRDISKAELKIVKPVERREFLRKLMYDKISVQNEQFEADLKILLNSNLAERQKMAERDDAIGKIAICSLYMLSSTIIGIYAGIKKLPFWEAWESFGNQQYTDYIVIEENEDEEEELGKIPFYRQIRRENENEFLEYWDSSNLTLSEKMKEYIDLWQRWYEEEEDIQDISMEKMLAWIAEVVSEQYEVAYLDYDFVMEVLEHKDDKKYQKAVILFRKTQEKDCRLFPELTVKQAQEEIIKYYQCAEDKMALRAYQALLHNREQRKKLLGF